MSDDLISRKSLIENLNKFAPEHYAALVNDLIMKEPTAFDKEKVKQELEISSKLYSLNDRDCEFAILQNIALEIIEKGGIE